MSISCPNCGVEIVGVVIGSAPFPGWRNLAQNGATDPAQMVAQSQVAHGSKDLSSKDLEPKTYAQRRRSETYPPEFLRFWSLYPRKRDKRKALNAWRNAIRRSSQDVINAGAIRYRDDPNRLDEFTKYAEGWLNGDGWEDEPLPSRLPRNVEPAAPKPLTDADYRAALDARSRRALEDR